MFSTGAFRTLRRVMALAAIAAAFSFASEAQAGRYSKGTGIPGWGSGSSGGSGGSSSSGGVPEIDAGSAAGAVSLLVGGVFLLRDQFNRRGKKAE